VQYLSDAIQYFGSYEVPGIGGNVTRFRLFDAAHDGGERALCGQEASQQELVEVVTAAARSGRLDRMIVLHGPNGSGKSSLVELLFRGLESYSHTPEGALYALRWIFPKGGPEGAGLGFRTQRGEEPDSYALLEPDDVASRAVCELRDNPLFVVPDSERGTLLEEALAQTPERRRQAYPHFVTGNLCAKCKTVYEGLLAAYKGDWRKVVRHVQVERVFVSRRFRVGAVVTQPQGTADAGLQPLGGGGLMSSLPSFLQSCVLYDVVGDLPDANRGLLEFSDFLKRNLEFSKYLLQTTEKGFVTVGNQLLELDIVFLATVNERHLEAFKQSPEFASFQGRMHFVRVPYLRELRKEAEIYRVVCKEMERTRHVAPHVPETLATFAVLTRLERPQREHYGGELRDVCHDLTPLEKAWLYSDGRAPDRLDSATARELVRAVPDLRDEFDQEARFEGRAGASVREVRTVLMRAAVRQDARTCVTPSAVVETLAELVQERSTHRFLQFPPDGPYHDPEALLAATRHELAQWILHDVQEAMELISEAEYDRRFDRYFQHLVAHTRGEAVRDPLTGRGADPDLRLLESVERLLPLSGPVEAYRRGLVSRIGAYAVDHPDERPIDFRKLFPDLLRAVRRNFFDERRELVTRVQRHLLAHGTPDFSDLAEPDRRLAERTLENLTQRSGYCVACAQDAVDFALTGLRVLEE
jgi:serine protein kinase